MLFMISNMIKAVIRREIIPRIDRIINILTNVLGFFLRNMVSDFTGIRVLFPDPPTFLFPILSPFIS